MRRKVTVVGAGNVGATVAQRVFDKGYADVALIDIIEGLPQGKALDMLESGPVLGTDATVVGSNSYEVSARSDIVVITSGVPRKPGMSRDDLLFTNMDIIGNVTRKVVEQSPDCILVIVTNPLDAMAQHAYEVSGFPRERVIGMAGVLDTARFRTFLAQELHVSVDDVHAYVLGGHGDQMVPLTGYSNVAGVPVSQLLPKEQLEAIVQRTRDGGIEIVNYLKTGSAFYAPSAAVASMIEAIVLDKKQVLPCCVLLQGEYNVQGLFVGVPVKLGTNGMEEVLQLVLSPEEYQELRKSVETVRELVDKMHGKAATG